MSKGAILIGVGFTPKENDVKLAIKTGHMQDASRIRCVYTWGAIDRIKSDWILEQYERRLKSFGWDLPGDLQVLILVNNDGGEMLFVYPKTFSSEQAFLPSREAFDNVLAQVFSNRPPTTPTTTPTTTPIQQQGPVEGFKVGGGVTYAQPTNTKYPVGTENSGSDLSPLDFLQPLLAGLGYYLLLTEQGRNNILALNPFMQLGIVVITMVATFGLVTTISGKIKKESVQSRFQTVGWALSIIIPMAAYLYFFWLQAPITFASFRPYLEEYESSSGLTEINGEPVLSGKLITVDKYYGGFDDLYYSLPDDLRAQTPNEVSTIVWVKCFERAVSTYVSGGKGYIYICEVTVIDKDRSLIFIPSKIFEGAPPPESKRGRGDWHGSKPITPMVDYIEALSRR